MSEDQSNVLTSSTDSLSIATPATELAAEWQRIFQQRMNRQEQRTAAHPSASYLTYENLRQNTPWGHLLKQKDPAHIRLYSVNINGIALDKEGGKFGEFCQVMDETQSDIGCVQEHNLDTMQYQVRQQLSSTTQKRWQWQWLSTGSTPLTFASQYKPGGTLILSANSITSRVIDSGSDKWGRWTYQSFQGKNQIIVTVISAYQVVDSASGLQGQITASAQQQVLLIETNDSLTQPRYAFRRDLRRSLQEFQDKGHDIILVGDFNEKLGDDVEGMSNIALECNLVDIMANSHPALPEPATYARGRTRLDYILTSARVATTVRHCGYEAFHHRVHTDHRAYYVDFDSNSLFGTQLQELARHAGRGLHANNVRQVTAYIKRKHALLITQNAFARAERLTATGNRHRFAERLDRNVLHASLAAENSVNSFREPAWSVALAQARKRVALLKRLLSMHKTKLDLSAQVRDLGRQIDDDFIHPTTVHECSQMLRDAAKITRDIINAQYQHREAERTN